METAFAVDLFLALLLGFMIGMQREIQNAYEKSFDFGGARTFALISLIGYLGAYFQQNIDYLFAVLLGATILFIASIHKKSVELTKDIGTTTEFAAIATLFVGACVHLLSRQSAVFLAVMILFVLVLKGKLKNLKGKISKQDIDAAVLFALMSLVILPILPNRAVDPLGVLNLHKIWLMVVLISGISFFGYLSVKLVGAKKGLLLTGFFGGLVSSTAVSITMSKRASLDTEARALYAIAIGIACSTMFLRVVAEVFVVNPDLLEYLLWPFVSATLSGYLLLLLFYLKTRGDSGDTALELQNPLELGEALKIGVAFGAVFALITLSNRFFGDTGVYAVSLLSGITDVDAITLTLADLSEKETIEPHSAAIGIVLASVANSIAKLALVFYFGGYALGRYLLLFFGVSLSAMGIAFFFTL